jgi:acyl-CoA thioester hydrolase
MKNLDIKNNFQNLNGTIQGNEHFYYLKVYYEDTDAGQIVYHTNYLKYFERARTSLLNLLKINQVDLRKNYNLSLVVRKANILWHKSAFLNDTILIKSCLKYAKNSSITITQYAYRVMNVDEEYELLVKGTIQIVAINNEFKVKRINKILNNKFFQNK